MITWLSDNFFQGGVLAKLGCEWVMPGHCWKQENKLAREEVQDVVSRGLDLQVEGRLRT